VAEDALLLDVGCVVDAGTAHRHCRPSRAVLDWLEASANPLIVIGSDDEIGNF
jgi:hypothetical protein